ncbi:MAG TPA: PLP-dependent aminotransferase family protein [Anaerolineae bacterium]
MTEKQWPPLQIAQLSTGDDFIDFGIGQPGVSLLPLELLRRAAAERLQQPERAILQYGAEAGDGYFRLALADFLSDGYGVPVLPEQLFITNGVSQALDLICTLFTRPGDVVFVEEPTYFLALHLFADHGLQVVGLPTDEHGLVTNALAEKLKWQRPVFLYTIPSFQNPAGWTLPESRRQRLVSLSQEYGFTIVADEVYHLLSYMNAPPAPLAHYGDGETVISLGSFSKILAPGLRLGWIEASPPIVERLSNTGLLQSGGGLNPFTSAIVRSVLEKGWQQQHLEQLRTTYSRRAAALAAALRRHFAAAASFSEPEGGFFIWLTLPEEVDTSDLLPLAQAQKVGFRPGVNFSCQGKARNSLRLCFAFYDTPTLEAGAAGLADAYQDYNRN